MGFTVMAMLAFVLTTCFMSTAGSAPCPLDTVDISITSTADVQNLTGLLDCVGQGVFNVTWHSNLAIDETIELSGGSNVTITGHGLDGDNAAGVIMDAGSVTGIFSVSEKSTLRLNNIGLEGGNAEDGGAVALFSSSTLYVFGCTFTYNNASNGGALFASDSSIYVDGSTSFGGNTALYGGVIYARATDVGISGNAMFTNNSAKNDGGVIYARATDVGISGNAMFTNNSAEDDGGVIYSDSSNIGIDGNASFTRNLAGDDGGAVYASESKIALDGYTQFSSNNAVFWGGWVRPVVYCQIFQGTGTRQALRQSRASVKACPSFWAHYLVPPLEKKI